MKNRALITVSIVLFGLRLFQRLLNLEGVEQNLGVTDARNWATIATVGFLALALGLLRWKLYRAMHPRQPRATPAPEPPPTPA